MNEFFVEGAEGLAEGILVCIFLIFWIVTIPVWVPFMVIYGFYSLIRKEFRL